MRLEKTLVLAIVIFCAFWFAARLHPEQSGIGNGSGGVALTVGRAVRGDSPRTAVAIGSGGATASAVRRGREAPRPAEVALGQADRVAPVAQRLPAEALARVVRRGAVVQVVRLAAQPAAAVWPAEAG